MKYIAWDTETSGLPRTRQKATHENVKAFDTCRMVSFAYVEYDSNGKDGNSYHGVVYPDTFQVGATHVHGISHEYALEHGVPFEKIYNKIIECIKVSGFQLFVAHNSPFDESVLFSECYRRGLDVKPFEDIHFICSLYKSRAMLPSLSNHKLITVYTELFGESFDGAHDALVDSRACGDVYHKLRTYVRVLKPIDVDVVTLKASDVASMIGSNPYKKPREIIDGLWFKYFPKTFKGRTKEQEAEYTIRACPASQKLLEDVEKFKSTSSRSTDQKFRAISNQLESKSKLNERERALVVDHMRKVLFTNHGTEHEADTANCYDNMIEDDTFYNMDVSVLEGTVYRLVGKIDRIQVNGDGSRTLVEIKNRVKALFNNVREYEEIQCQTYMQMLDLKHCKLIEQHDEVRKVHMIERDDIRWKTEILPKIKMFCEEFHSIMSRQ